jgi:hypothetical protein
MFANVGVAVRDTPTNTRIRRLNAVILVPLMLSGGFSAARGKRPGGIGAGYERNIHQTQGSAQGLRRQQVKWLLR